MFEEAATIASSVLKRVCDNKSTDVGEDDQLYEIIESAGMVLVQSLKELGRYLIPCIWFLLIYSLFSVDISPFFHSSLFFLFTCFVCNFVDQVLSAQKNSTLSSSCSFHLLLFTLLLASY